MVNDYLLSANWCHSLEPTDCKGHFLLITTYPELSEAHKWLDRHLEALFPSLSHFHTPNRLFFTDGAIKCTQDAWWDMDVLCIVTKADQEMSNILAYNTDLIFLKTKLELDMSRATTPAKTIAKIQDDLLSTGSISTFQSLAMAATKQSRAMWKSMMRSKPTESSTNSNTNTNMVISLVTLSESNIQVLLTWLTQAMNLQNSNKNKTTSKEPTDSQNTGSQKWTTANPGRNPHADPREISQMTKWGKQPCKQPSQCIYKTPQHTPTNKNDKRHKQQEIRKQEIQITPTTTKKRGQKQQLQTPTMNKLCP